jgi:hypothetical protein
MEMVELPYVTANTNKKLKMKFKFLLFVILVVLTFNGCKKEKPSDPVSVKAQTFSVTNWTYSSPSYYANYADAEITSTVQSSGTVNLFFSSDGGTTWQALPFTKYNGSSDYYWGYNVSVGYVQPTWTYSSSLSSGSDPNAVYGVTAKFKVVCISAGARQANPDLNLNDYQKIKERFNLAD